MATSFLFLDECMYEPLDLAALTGVLVPAEHYVAVRDAMCQLAAEVQPSPPHTIPRPIELHGRALLNDVEDLHGTKIDTVRLSVWQRVADLISEYQLQVCRVTYLNRKEIAAAMPLDSKLYGITFLGIQFWLQNVMAESLVIPVIDGVPTTGGRRASRVDPVLIQAFAGNVRTWHNCRQYQGMAESMGKVLQNMHNLGEPVFSDSAHSVLLQVVDLVSHLLLQLERDELEDCPAGGYREQVLKIAETLPADLLHLSKTKMRVD